MSSWLQKHRKADLVQLAEQAGMEGTADTMRKEDILVALEQHLHANASTLSKRPAFQEYFNRVRSPIKKESEVFPNIPFESIARSMNSRSRRVSKMPSSDPDLETERETSSPMVSRTSRMVQDVAAALPRAPRAVQDVASSLSLPMPPSPSAVTDLVEQQTEIAAKEIRKYYDAIDIPSYLSGIRENLSSVLAVETAFLLLEAWGLQRATLPWRYAFSIPPSAASRGKTIPMFFPDFFALLTGSFWGPTSIWVTTSLLLPTIVGWLVNFNLVFGRGGSGGYEVDPLVFNITKVLITWLVYSQGLRFGGMFSDDTVMVVESAILGGWRGIVIGAVVTAVMTLYEAILRR